MGWLKNKMKQRGKMKKVEEKAEKRAEEKLKKKMFKSRKGWADANAAGTTSFGSCVDFTLLDIKTAAECHFRKQVACKNDPLSADPGKQYVGNSFAHFAPPFWNFASFLIWRIQGRFAIITLTSFEARRSLTRAIYFSCSTVESMTST